MLKHLLFFFAMINFAVCDEFVVHLPTNTSQGEGVYLATLRPCETPYEEALYETLRSDLNFLQEDALLPISEPMQFYAHNEDAKVSFQTSTWRSFGARFVIVPRVEKEALSLQIFDAHTATLKTLTPIALTRDLKKDLPALHKVSDLVSKIVFGVEGITSKKILYSRGEPIEGDSFRAEIWEMDYNGKHAKQVTDENSYCITPVFVPNKKHPDNYLFLYVTYKQGPPRIYISARNRLTGVPLIPLKGNQLLPAISPKGDKIAFISDASGRADLFVQPYETGKGAVGKPFQLYSFPGSVQASPSFSPDGSKIAFVSDKNGSPRIYMIDVVEDRKTPEPKLLSKATHDSTSPSFSPDGKKIAFSAKTNGVRQIWIYDIEKGEEHPITAGNGDKENPSWAGDSLHLVYNTTSPTHDIFMININKAHPIRLTEGPGIKHYPVFEP